MSEKTNVEIASDLNKAIVDNGNFIQSLIDRIKVLEQENQELKLIKASAIDATLKLTLLTTIVVGG